MHAFAGDMERILYTRTSTQQSKRIGTYSKALAWQKFSQGISTQTNGGNLHTGASKIVAIA